MTTFAAAHAAYLTPSSSYAEVRYFCPNLDCPAFVIHKDLKREGLADFMKAENLGARDVGYPAEWSDFGEADESGAFFSDENVRCRYCNTAGEKL